MCVLHLNLFNILLAWENSRCFARSQLEPSQNNIWKTSTEIPYTDDVHYPDLGSASDWLKENSLAAQPIRSATKIWVVHVISRKFLHSLLRRRLARAQVATLRIVGCFLRLIFYSIVSPLFHPSRQHHQVATNQGQATQVISQVSVHQGHQEANHPCAVQVLSANQ